MTQKDSRDASSSRKGLKIGLSAVLLMAAGFLGYRHYANADVDPGPQLTSLQDRSWEVECSACGEKYSMSAAEYLAKVADRSEGAAGIVCERCGASAAWRAKRPIEYTDEQWKAGWVGRDVLISELKAHNKAHPEGKPVAAVPEDEDDDG